MQTAAVKLWNKKYHMRQAIAGCAAKIPRATLMMADDAWEWVWLSWWIQVNYWRELRAHLANGHDALCPWRLQRVLVGLQSLGEGSTVEVEERLEDPVGHRVYSFARPDASQPNRQRLVPRKRLTVSPCARLPALLEWYMAAIPSAGETSRVE
jgi:hypothetical protein